jgi:hypothetical protein
VTDMFLDGILNRIAILEELRADDFGTEVTRCPIPLELCVPY